MGWLKKNIKNDKWTEILFDTDDMPTDISGNFLVNVAYRRVSTDKQAAEGYGLDVQRNDIIRYCEHNGVKNCILFTDDGVTGTKMERDGLDHFVRMVKNFNDGESKIKVNSLIVPRMDRLSRSLLGTLQFIQDYVVNKADSRNSLVNTNTYDIDFISIQEPFCRVDKNNPTSKLMLTLFASLAEYDRDQIVAKLERGRVERVKSGKPMGGGKAPYGYRYDRESGMYVVVPEEKEKVCEIFRLYVEEKMSPAKIASLLGFKSERVVSQILKRRTSLGYLPYKGKEYRGNHEPLISENVFEAAKQELERRSVVRGASSYMLSGLVYCGNCGAKMRYQKWGNDVKIVCYSQQHSKPYLVKDPDCKNEKYFASDVEKAVIDELFSMSYFNSGESKTETEYSISDGLKREISKKQEELKRLYNVYASSDSEQLLQVIKTREKELSSLKLTLDGESKRQAVTRRVEHSKKVLRGLRDAWEHMSAEEKKTVCGELIEKVVITGGAKPSIDVYFKLQKYLSSEKTA